MTGSVLTRNKFPMMRGISATEVAIEEEVETPLPTKELETPLATQEIETPLAKFETSLGMQTEMLAAKRRQHVAPRESVGLADKKTTQSREAAAAKFDTAIESWTYTIRRSLTYTVSGAFGRDRMGHVPRVIMIPGRVGGAPHSLVPVRFL